MLKKTTERTLDKTRSVSTITTAYRLLGQIVYVKVVDYSLAKDFPAKA